MDVRVYSKEGCPWCVKTEALLRELRIPYTEVKIDENLKNRQELLETVPGARTVPQVVIDGRVIGGYWELVSWANNRPERD